MHKQLSQEGNQGACSQSLGLIAGKSSKFKCNSWKAPAPRLKPVLGTTWQHHSVAVFRRSGQMSRRNEHRVFEGTERTLS